jgi:hypothetical protein
LVDTHVLFKEAAMAQNNRQTRINTADGFRAEMEAFEEQVKKACDPERPCFPNFRLGRATPEEIQGTKRIEREGRLDDAFKALDAARHHFNCSRAAYFRHYVEQQVRFDAKYAHDNETNVVAERDALKKVFDALDEEVSRNYFDVDKASTLYWALVDHISTMKQRQGLRADVHELRKAFNPLPLSRQPRYSTPLLDNARKAIISCEQFVKEANCDVDGGDLLLELAECAVDEVYKELQCRQAKNRTPVLKR